MLCMLSSIFYAKSLKLSRFVSMLQILLLLLLLLPRVGLLLQQAKLGRDARQVIHFCKPSCERCDFSLRKSCMSTKCGHGSILGAGNGK
jgi:hypothetical protein